MRQQHAALRLRPAGHLQGCIHAGPAAHAHQPLLHPQQQPLLRSQQQPLLRTAPAPAALRTSCPRPAPAAHQSSSAARAASAPPQTPPPQWPPAPGRQRRAAASPSASARGRRWSPACRPEQVARGSSRRCRVRGPAAGRASPAAERPLVRAAAAAADRNAAQSSAASQPSPIGASLSAPPCLTDSSLLDPSWAWRPPCHRHTACAPFLSTCSGQVGAGAEGGLVGVTG